MIGEGACREPDNINEALVELRKGLEEKRFLVLAGRCWVEYEGRGASTSTPGDRIVIVKPSRSIIVHGPEGFKPENWQPDGSIFHATVKDGLLVLRAVRRKPREILIVYCDRIYAITSFHPSEKGAFYMYMPESEIRDVLAKHPYLIEEGLRTIDIEKPVEAGFIDLYLQDKHGNMVVVEVKRVRAGGSGYSVEHLS
jgi:RecB family endonuclease NucS